MAMVYEPPGSVPAPQMTQTAQQGLQDYAKYRQDFGSGAAGWAPQFGKDNSLQGWGTPGVNDQNVYASQGAGASGASAGGRSWLEGLGNRSMQAQQMGQQMGQQQMGAQQAAMLRAMPTPGGVDQWHQNMMQGLARARTGMMGSQGGQWLQQQQSAASQRPGASPWGMSTPWGNFHG